LSIEKKEVAKQNEKLLNRGEGDVNVAHTGSLPKEFPSDNLFLSTAITKLKSAFLTLQIRGRL
jgi:hypothetical protein